MGTQGGSAVGADGALATANQAAGDLRAELHESLMTRIRTIESDDYRSKDPFIISSAVYRSFWVWMAAAVVLMLVAILFFG